MICAAAFAVASGPRRPLSACETKPATSKKPRQTQPWPGIRYFGTDAARVVWMEDKDGKSSDTIYDGKDQGPLYSQESLDADLAAAELVIAAIRSPEVITSAELELNDALEHVRASLHLYTEPPQNWLSWFVRRLCRGSSGAGVAPAEQKLQGQAEAEVKRRRQADEVHVQPP
jgi:hypothetical protein